MNYIVLNEWKFSEWWTGKDVERSGHATIWGVTSGGPEKIHEKLQLWLPICGRIFEPGTSGIRSSSANDSSATFGCYVLEDSVYWPQFSHETWRDGLKRPCSWKRMWIAVVVSYNGPLYKPSDNLNFCRNHFLNIIIQTIYIWMCLSFM
jgi:hypothetical protein